MHSAEHRIRQPKCRAWDVETARGGWCGSCNSHETHEEEHESRAVEDDGSGTTSIVPTPLMRALLARRGTRKRHPPRCTTNNSNTKPGRPRQPPLEKRHLHARRALRGAEFRKAIGRTRVRFSGRERLKIKRSKFCAHSRVSLITRLCLLQPSSPISLLLLELAVPSQQVLCRAVLHSCHHYAFGEHVDDAVYDGERG